MGQPAPLLSRCFTFYQQIFTLSSKRPFLRRARWSFASTFKLGISTFKDIPGFEYRPIEGLERLERYCPGGYHPASIGDVLKDRYRIVHKLGHGTYSTIWLSRDEQRKAYVAIKISTADSPRCEVDVLRAITDSSGVNDLGPAMMPSIQDQFEIEGPNGSHSCFVTSPAQSSIATARFSRVFKLETARVLVAQLVIAVAHVHAQGFVHGGESFQFRTKSVFYRVIRVMLARTFH